MHETPNSTVLVSAGDDAIVFGGDEVLLGEYTCAGCRVHLASYPSIGANQHTPFLLHLTLAGGNPLPLTDTRPQSLPQTHTGPVPHIEQAEAIRKHLKVQKDGIQNLQQTLIEDRELYASLPK
jgi:hypothetical protein